MRFLKSLALTMSLLPAFAMASPEANVETIMFQTLKEFGTNKTLQDELVFGQFPQLSSEQKEIVREHLTELFTNDRFNHYLGRTILSALNLNEVYLHSKEEQVALGSNLIFPILQNLSHKGLRRLSPEIQLESLKQALIMMENTDAETCRYLAFGYDSVDPYARKMKKNNLALIKVFSPEELRTMYRIHRMAIFSEINDTPRAKELTAHEAAFAEQVFSKTLLKEIQTFPVRQQERISQVLINPEAASDKEACLCGKIVYRAMIKAPGIGGEWFRQSIWQ